METMKGSQVKIAAWLDSAKAPFTYVRPLLGQGFHTLAISFPVRYAYLDNEEAEAL